MRMANILRAVVQARQVTPVLYGIVLLSGYGTSCHSRQPQHPQTEKGPLAVQAQEHPLSLHAHQRVVAQSNRDLVQHSEPQGIDKPKLHLSQTTAGTH